MPKDEFDFEDPLELNGVGIICSEDTTEAMTECFVEEFMRLGYNQKQILAFFRNPHYLGMNMALQNRGEEFVKEKIREVFARWGRWIQKPCVTGDPGAKVATASASAEVSSRDSAFDDKTSAIDPMGEPAPDLTL